MYRRISLVALVSALAVALAAPAGLAAAKKRHTIDSTIQAALVSAAPGGGAVVAGTVADPRFGDGATVYRTQPVQNGVQTSTFVAYFDKGAFKGTASVRVTPQADGSVLVEGEGAITRGTGRYRGAKGALDLTGSISAQGAIQFTAKGSVRY